MRGLDNVKFIYCDESDFFPPFQQKEVRAVMEGYIGKPNSDPHIVTEGDGVLDGSHYYYLRWHLRSCMYNLFREILDTEHRTKE